MNGSSNVLTEYLYGCIINAQARARLGSEYVLYYNLSSLVGAISTSILSMRLHTCLYTYDLPIINMDLRPPRIRPDLEPYP